MTQFALPADLSVLFADNDNNGAQPFVTTDTPFAVITDRPMPDFDSPSGRAVYPFADMVVGNSFYAGKKTKVLMGRLYSAKHTRLTKFPTENYQFEVMDNGDVYVWKTAA